MMCLPIYEGSLKERGKKKKKKEKKRVVSSSDFAKPFLYLPFDGAALLCMWDKRSRTCLFLMPI